MTRAEGRAKARKIYPRKDHDFYPTPPEATHALVQYLGLKDELIWEPAAGDGAMADVLAEAGNTVRRSDIRDVGREDTEVLDFLDPRSWVGPRWPGWIITNPPYGKLAEAFIRRALSKTDRVAMLLSSDYWHAASRRELFCEHTPSHVLPLTWRLAFLESERGKSPMGNSIWTVWSPRGFGTNAIYLPLRKPE